MMGTPWLWTVLAVLLFVGGAYCLLRFGIGDRARGRRRCRGCWYDMGGGGDICPECGRVARSPRDLARSRRPKRWAVAGVVFLLLGSGLLATRHAVVHGAKSLVPDWVLIAGMERWRPNGPLLWELLRREQAGELSVGEQRRLIGKSIKLLQSDPTHTSALAAALIIQAAEDTGAYEAERHSEPWNTWVRASEVADARSIALALLAGFENSGTASKPGFGGSLAAFAPTNAIAVPTLFVNARADLPARLDAAQTLRGIMGEIPPAYGELPRIITVQMRLAGPPSEFLTFAQSLKDHQYDLEALRGDLQDGLASESTEVQLLSLWMIRSCFWPDDELRLMALALYDPASRHTAWAIEDFATAGPLDEAAVAVIRQALDAGFHIDRVIWTLREFGERGDQAAAFAPQAKSLLERTPSAALSYAQITGEDEAAARALLAFARPDPVFLDGLLLRELARVGWLGEEVIALWREELESADAELRLGAATALLRSGPPAGFDRAELTRIAAEASSGSGTGWFAEAVRYGEADVGALIEVLDSGLTLNTNWIILALGASGSAAEDALPWLRNQAKFGISNAAWAVRRIEWCLRHGDPPPEPRVGGWGMAGRRGDRGH